MPSTKLAFLKDNLQTETESVFEPEIKKKKKAGRKPKIKGTKFSQRVTFLITEEQKAILDKKRRSGEFGEMDLSIFLREWLNRTGLFNNENISTNALDNLPPHQG